MYEKLKSKNIWYIYESFDLILFWTHLKPKTPENAVRVKCKNDQCKTVCKQGFVSKAKSKVKCKQKENGKYKWNADELSKCITCDPEKLKFDDDRIERDCIILATTRLRKCTVKCSNNEKLFGKKKIEMECKCPRKGFSRICSLMPWVFFVTY